MAIIVNVGNVSVVTGIKKAIIMKQNKQTIKEKDSWLKTFLLVVGFPIILVIKFCELLDYMFEYEEVKYRKPELYEEYLRRCKSK